MIARTIPSRVAISANIQTSTHNDMYERYHYVCQSLTERACLGVIKLNPGQTIPEIAKEICRRDGFDYPGWEIEQLRRDRVLCMYLCLAFFVIVVVILNCIVQVYGAR